MVPAKDRSILRYGSAAARSGILQLLPMTARCACESVRLSKRELTTDITGYMTSLDGITEKKVYTAIDYQLINGARSRSDAHLGTDSQLSIRS